MARECKLARAVNALRSERRDTHMFSFKRLLAPLLTLVAVSTPAQSSQTSPSSAVAGTRAMALSVKPADLGLSPSAYTDRPWGVLMETGLDGGASYSLVVLADGSISLYFSTGGGFIGTGGNASVRRAGDAMLGAATRFQSRATPAPSTPLPDDGQVNFYLLTSKGTLRYGAPEQRLGKGDDEFSDLFYAGQNVITAIREMPRPAATGAR